MTQHRKDDSKMSADSRLRAIACQPWCEDHDGHERELYAMDQYCTSRPVQVRLSMEDVEVTPESAASFELAVLVTDDHGTLSVSLETDRSGTLHMTADEAEKLAQVLMDHAHILRADDGR